MTTYTNVGNKADLVFLLLASELPQIAQMHRDVEEARELCASFTPP